LTVYLLFASVAATTEKSDKAAFLRRTKLICDEQTQYRCAGYLQAEIDQFGTNYAAATESQIEGNGDGSAAEDEDASDGQEETSKKAKVQGKQKGKAKALKASAGFSESSFNDRAS